MKTTVPIRSTAIVSASYDEATQEMDVTFTNGRTYTHPGVPSSVFESLQRASSPGSYYNQNIKGVYV